MTIASHHTRSRQFLFSFAVLCTPYIIFTAVLFYLFLLHGGQNYAILSKNPYCRLAIKQRNSPPAILLHISDLHVSSNPKSRAKHHLNLFRTQALPRWAPQASAILVSGDLVNAATHSRSPLGSRSEQSEDEWGWLDEYAASVNASVPWIATHGNHDTFGGNMWQSPHSATLSSLVYPTNSASHKIRKLAVCSPGAANVTVLALDCTLPAPLHRPLNFFGDANAAADKLSPMLDEVEQRDEGPVIAFGHYPSAVMAGGAKIHRVSAQRDAEGRRMKPRIAAFLSGHLHTLKGTARTGLQTVSKSGAFELQLTDMVETGAYRILAVDNGFLTFKDFSIFEDQEASSVNDIVVTNPPRAGFCSAGSGFAALQSTHVRFLVPVGINGTKFDVYIDGTHLGTGQELPSACNESDVDVNSTTKALCVRVFGVEWSAKNYDDGNLHTLTFRHAEKESKPYLFSLDGREEAGLKNRLRTLVSALFSLSDFDIMAFKLCKIGLVLCVLFCLPGLRLRQKESLALCTLVFVLRFGPAFLIAKGLTSTDPNIGMVGLKAIRLPSGDFNASVDVPYIMSVTILYGSLLPLCVLDGIVALAKSNSIFRHVLESSITPLFVALYMSRCISWCLEISGAHGFQAALLSPSCVPAFLVLSMRAMVILRMFWGKRLKLD